MDEICHSRFWDANITWYTDNPDFTDCFKNTVLIWIPCLYLWIFLPLEIHKIRNSKDRNISFNTLNITKSAAITLIGLLQALKLYLDFTGDLPKPSIYVYSSILKLFSLILFLALVWMNRKMGIRFSKTLLMFSFLLTLFEIPSLRVKIRNNIKLDSIDDILHILNFILSCITLMLNCFTDSPPRYSIYSKKKVHSVNDSSPITFLSSRSLNNFIWKCHKQPGATILCDLKSENKAEKLYSKFEKIWMKSYSRNKDMKNEIKCKILDGRTYGDSCDHSLFKTLTIMFWSTTIFNIVSKACYEILGLVIPLIFKLFISLMMQQAPAWKGYLCAFMFLVIILCQSVLNENFINNISELDGTIKTTLVTAIYRKLLKISKKARTKYSTADVSNLISVDASYVMLIPRETVNVISSATSILLSYYILWHLLGYSVLVGILVMILFVPLNHYLGKTEKTLQKLHIKNKDKRAKFMQELLTGIKILKMYSWETSFKTEAFNLRKNELKVLMRMAYLNIITMFTFLTIPFFISLATFAAYVLSSKDNVLDIEKAFISIIIFTSFRTPQYKLPIAISSLLQANVSLKRINEFLNSEEMENNIITHDDAVEEVLIIENGSFSWDSYDGLPILQDINIKIKENSLIGIVGHVGSGKSSLISACLGEMCKLSGSISLKGKITLIPQQAWILNTSFKENITLWENIDESTYKKALEICALEEDIASFPNGDLTEIGEKGINLSGGQKQRISLARAICSNADIFLFDDPLSAVDSNVANHIFDHVIGPKSILKNKTRLWVTHNIKFLSQVNQIIVMKNGSISEVGTYEELLNTNADFSDFLKIYSKEKKNDNSTINENLNNKKLTKETKNLENKNEIYIGNTNKLIKDELQISKHISKETFLFLLSFFGIFPFLIFTLTFLINQIGGALSNFWLAAWSTGNLLWIEDKNNHSQQYYLLFYAGFGFAQSISNILGGLILFMNFLKASDAIFQKLLTRVLQWPMWIFDSTPIGRIMNRFIDDIQNIEGKLASQIGMFMYLLARYICNIGILVWILPFTIVMIVPFLTVIFYVQKIYFLITQHLQRIQGSTRSPLYSHFVETINGLQSIRAYGYQKKFISFFDGKLETNIAATLSYHLCNSWLFRTTEIFCGLIIFSITCYATHQWINLDFGLIALALIFVIEVRLGLAAIVYYTNFIMEGMISVERIKEYLDLPIETNSNLCLDVSSDWPQNGEIIFQNYKMQYRQSLDLVLKGISFSITGGEKVGIIGRTGAGKTSLLLALFRIVEPAEGAVFIDNIDISKIKFQILRSRLTVIPQDPVLFLGSLRFNLDPFTYYTDQEIWKALEKIQFSQYFSNITGGLSYMIEEGGNNLSFGQRQLICLARALLRKTKILVLDEATASVDLKTDDFIQKIIKKNFAQCTVLTIAHRLNTIQDYDKIIVMEDGYVVEFDSPKNLLERKDSKYYQMAKDSGLAVY